MSELWPLLLSAQNVSITLLLLRNYTLKLTYLSESDGYSRSNGGSEKT